MSGQGRGQCAKNGVRVVAEVRAVNHRFCQVFVRLPTDLAALEETVRKRIQQRVQRGKIDLVVTVERLPGSDKRVNWKLAQSYLLELRQLAEQHGVPGEIDLSTLTSLPGVIGEQQRSNLDPKADAEFTTNAIDQALDRLDSMRLAEGADLAADLRGRCARMLAGVAEIDEAAAELPSRIRDKLQARIEVLLEGARLEPERIVQEVAHHAERADISEELVRLRSHLGRLGELLDGEEPVGRTLDFVTQEIHRELNTIGSKARDLEVANRIVDLKAELERIREQVQNIE